MDLKVRLEKVAMHSPVVLLVITLQVMKAELKSDTLLITVNGFSLHWLLMVGSGLHVSMETTHLHSEHKSLLLQTEKSP